MRSSFPHALAGLAALCLLSACSTSAPTLPATPAPPGAAAAVYERLFIDNASNLGEKAAAYCVGQGRGWALMDPDAQTLAELRHQVLVKPASACDTGQRGERVVDRASGRPALMFGAEVVHCNASLTECLVRGGYYEGPQNAQSNLYTLRQRREGWQASMALRGPGP
ncbi:MAG: hypothetical protein LBI66_10535 [Burkholderiaceae bacterium]|jgi:hypothetical protein|nr:hypothetical protein [Burkholderiaceae bacterium]